MAKRIVVIPQYNEERTIIGVLERTQPYADLIVVVNDGSTDQSGSLVRQWANDHPGIALLTLDRNQGMSGALLIGFSYVMRLAAVGYVQADDVVINIDADGQHLPEEIPVALAAMEASGADVLLGRRNLAGYPWFKWVGNWGLSLWASLLTGYRYYDVECGFRLMRVEVLEDVLPFFAGKRYGCAQELGIITARRGWKINNRFPTRIAYYRAGARVRDGLTNLWMGLRAFIRVTINRPSRISEQTSTVFSLKVEHFDRKTELTLAPWTTSS